MDSSNLTESHIDNNDISIPVILAEVSPGRYNVIDGNHRIEKAHRAGVNQLPAYMIKPEVHTRFLTSMKAYNAYIDYWNSKIKAGAVRFKEEPLHEEGLHEQGYT